MITSIIVFRIVWRLAAQLGLPLQALTLSVGAVVMLTATTAILA